jgi:hypothetical protein
LEEESRVVSCAKDTNAASNGTKTRFFFIHNFFKINNAVSSCR